MLDAHPDEGDVPAYFDAARPLLPPAFQRLDTVVLADGGVRARVHEGPIRVDAVVKIAAEDGALVARVASLDRLPIDLSALARRFDARNRGITFLAATFSRAPRQIRLSVRFDRTHNEK